MRFIQKQEAPDFFKTDTENLSDWKKYKRKKKRLKKHILEHEHEQDHLCCYCEKGITFEGTSSHIEHIKPQTKYPELVFEYYNLLVSCQGDHCNDPGDSSAYICGHKKDDDYEYDKFLDPTKYEDISEYFTFNYEGEILPSKKDVEKSQYTIDLLNLNGENNRLAEARKKTVTSLKKVLKELPIEVRKTKLRKILADKKREFGTFLRYRFQKIL